MSCYQIIQDEEALRAFIDWLPELEEHEKYLVHLQARKKYMPEMVSSDKSQLKRLTAHKGNLFDKIRQMECPIGSFKTNRGVPIEQKALVLYITPNPRCMRKATFQGIKALVSTLENGRQNLNPHAEVLTNVHRSKSRSCFVHFDLDDPGLTGCEIYDILLPLIGESFDIVETHSGYHILVRPQEVVSKHKNWHPLICKALPGIDQVGDLMLPVVGCCQGGFVPKFVVKV